MGLFKTVDEKFKAIGFIKTRDDEYIVDYEKEVKAFGYIHQISLCHKASGRHIIQSYEKDSQSLWLPLPPDSQEQEAPD